MKLGFTLKPNPVPHPTGIVTVWNNQKLQESNQHILNISVTDGVFTAYSRLVVTISPVNARSPTFRVAQYNARIQENAIKTTVAQVSARDDDSGRYGDVTYHFIGDKAHSFFRINENTGQSRSPYSEATDISFSAYLE